MSGTLYLCGTPIGNLEDITVRTLRTLRRVRFILAEDTRHSAKLLQHYRIRTPLVSCHEHNEVARSQEVVGWLENGHDVALITDAGMPAVSDPGFRVVRAVLEAGLSVTACPGPSATLTALALSGLPTDSFLFLGFLPRKGKVRQEALATCLHAPHTVVLFEAPSRVAGTLQDLAAQPLREAAVARELTKRYEEVVRGTVSELAHRFAAKPPRGEVTIVLGPAPAEPPAQARDLQARLATFLAEGMDVNAAAKALASEAHVSKREAYRLALALRSGSATTKNGRSFAPSQD